ncbi:hypothetical protein RclHR1_00070043 [Rhizophagus clarus]|uniref:Transglutaminase domain-containing protein n=1 Tax=Rhizophagus clarus TaxID=94130 RepID=A0A2Z6RUG9_9GLOM|nr:hypothetical protein RclHR1_00070043 [Rhizophagus clarus]GES78216.1 transglutaminase domain-containing protein [Rhizophagus clarus]
MKSFFNKAMKRFSGDGSKLNDTSSYTTTTTTTTTTTRYDENGEPIVEVVTKTVKGGTNEEPVEVYETNKELTSKGPVEVYEYETRVVDDGTKPVEYKTENLVEKPIAKLITKPVEKLAGKHDKKPEERDPDEPELDESTVHQGERSDPASRCSPVVVANEFKEHLDLTDHDFSKVDKYARETPNAEAENCERLSKYLTKPWNNDLDKLRCIFTWITENIRYDTDAFFGGKMQHCGPEEVLKTRKSVCEGYAGLYDKLTSDAGLKVWKISGKSKGAGFRPGSDINSRQFDHAWNGVLYKGEFLFVDSTWGAGHLNGMDFERCFEPFYFLCSPTQFIYSHLPEKPEHQYVKPELTTEEFLELPYVKPQFFTSGLNFVKHLGTEIVVSDDKIVFEIERVHPDESKPLHATLEWEGHNEDIPVMIQRLGTPGPRGGRKYRLLCNCPSKGTGEFNIYVMLEGNSGPMVSKFKVKNSGNGKNYIPFVDTFSVPFSFTIQNPIHAKLNHNDNVKFEITIFDLPESELPSLALFLPEKSAKEFEKVSKGKDSYTFAIETCVDQKGKWGLTYHTSPTQFSFIAQYIVE